MASEARPSLPTGTVTFLFTDIERSTRVLTTLGDRYPEVLDRHNDLLKAAIDAHVGCEVEREGDSFFAVFPSAVAAVAAAAEAQRNLAAAPWPEGAVIRVRMGLHTGEGKRGGAGYVGMDVYRAARISAAGHGGQTLLSETTRSLVAHSLPPGATLRDLGDHRLKDLPNPERIWQLDLEGLRTEFPDLRSLERRPNNLPQVLTPLIGREQELADIARLLETQRLVTLTGPGGAGKTRLALTTAQRHLAEYADGAFFVPLDEARDRTSVAEAIGTALGIRERADRGVEEGLHTALRERELLLVLDNFEQVLDAAPLISALLSHAPRLRVLVTSRSVLHLTGEQDYEVPPLSLPPPAPPGTEARRSPAELSASEAVELFVERARAVKPDFSLTEGVAPAVAEITRRLDGLPLAIELAAARVRVLGPDEILGRLERRLQLLTGGAHDRPDRQRTLRSAIDWSFELLDDPERRLFSRLSVCAGGCTLESIEEMCNPGDELGFDTLEGLASLTDKSLIRPIPGGDGASRFEMLQVVREFASEQLDAGTDGEAVHRRHALHFLSLVEEAEPHLVRSDLRRWQERLRREEENLRAALRWAIDRGEAEIGLRMAGSLWRFWHYWGEFREGARWLEAVLAMPGADGPTIARALALTGLAGVRFWQGDVAGATALYEEGLPIYRELGNDHQVADALITTGWAKLVGGDVATARQLGEEALVRYQRAEDRVGIALVTAWLRSGEYITGLGGDAKSAVTAAREAVAAFRETERAFDEADWLAVLAMVYERSGDHENAWSAFREAVKTVYESRNLGALPWFKFGAKVQLARGQPERAATLAAIAQRSIEESGGELSVVITGAGDPLSEAQAILGPDVFERAVAEGRAMTTDQAVAYALEQD